MQSDKINDTRIDIDYEEFVEGFSPNWMKYPPEDKCSLSPKEKKTRNREKAEKIKLLERQRVEEWNAVQQAAASGNHLLLKHLLDKHPDNINYQGKDGSTPLHLAARALQLECVDVLLEQEGINLTLKDKSGRSPLDSTGLGMNNKVTDEERSADLSLSIQRGGSALDVVKKLIEKGAKVPDDVNVEMTLFVHMAVWREDIQLLEYLLDRNLVNLRLRDEWKLTVLQVAAYYELIAPLNTLLNYTNAVQEALNDYGGFEETPLHLAVRDGWVDGSRELLKAGADVTAITSAGKGKDSVLHLAARAAIPEVMEELLIRLKYNLDVRNKFGKCKRRNSLVLRDKFWKNHFVHHLLYWGANVNWRQSEDYTLLHLAIEVNNKSMVEYLLSNTQLRNCINKVTKLNINKGKFGTPLNMAVWRGQLDCVQVLIAYDADVFWPCPGFDFLDDSMQEVSQSGINLSHFTPLHTAAAKGHCEIIKFIVRINVDTLRARTLFGWTPLHVAAWVGQENSVKCLLEHGASLAESGPIFTKKELKVTALEMVLTKFPNPETFLKELFDSCILSGKVEKNSNNPKTHVVIKYDPILPWDDSSQFDAVQLLANCEECRKDIKKDMLLLHPVIESFVYRKVDNLLMKIIVICFIHYFFMISFCTIVGLWHTSESTPIIDTIGFIAMCLWFGIFVLQDSASEEANMPKRFSSWSAWSLYVSVLLAIVMTVSRFTSYAWITQYATLVLILMALLVFPLVLSYINPDGIYTIIVLLRGFLKVLLQVLLLFAVFMVIFATNLDVDEPFNNFGKKVIDLIDVAKDNIVKEFNKYTEDLDGNSIVMRVIYGLPMVGAAILKVNSYTGFTLKYIQSQAEKGRIEGMVAQIKFLDRLSIFSHNKQWDKISPTFSVYFNPKHHKSVIFGDRIWKSVAYWFKEQSDPERQDDKELFLKYMRIKS